MNDDGTLIALPLLQMKNHSLIRWDGKVKVDKVCYIANGPAAYGLHTHSELAHSLDPLSKLKCICRYRSVSP